ncbi:MAG: hypothetical protein HQ485_12190 [Acidobacteria bacterium]|nr:hypothetical protein [Acidobacteriota bacterium]
MPARSVVFFISGHGFGHASREVEVLNTLGEARPDIPLVVRTAASPSLLARTIRVPVTILEGACDTGVIQRDSVTHDDEATVVQAAAFQATMPARGAEECLRLAPFHVGVIVGDIPPLAFEVATQLAVPSVAIGNFTWDWIYEWYREPLRRAPRLLDDIRRGYRQATRALQLPLSGGFDVFPTVTQIPFIARHATRTRADTRQQLGLDARRPVALLSFGGYGLDHLDLASLDCLDDWTIVVTGHTGSSGNTGVGRSKQIHVLPESTFDVGLRYEDVVAAVDVVVTKPGYGIVSECVAHNIAVLYTSRGHFREYELMVAEMPTLLRCRFLDQTALFAGQWRTALEALMQQSVPLGSVATDGARRASDVIQEMHDVGSAPASKSAAN